MKRLKRSSSFRKNCIRITSFFYFTTFQTFLGENRVKIFACKIKISDIIHKNAIYLIKSKNEEKETNTDSYIQKSTQNTLLFCQE
jgi:hypothetical protein